MPAAQAPARHRDAYIIGRAGNHFAPTTTACEQLMRAMTACLRTPECEEPMVRERVLWDRTLVLDRWTALTRSVSSRDA